VRQTNAVKQLNGEGEQMDGDGSFENNLWQCVCMGFKLIVKRVTSDSMMTPSGKECCLTKNGIK